MIVRPLLCLFTLIFSFPRAFSLPLERAKRFIAPNLDIPAEKEPWVVQVNSHDKRECTGSLITDRHVLTAGHCLDARNKVNCLEIVLNTVDMKKIPARQYWLHPNYKYNSFVQIDSHDIALIELSAPVTVSTIPVLDAHRYTCSSVQRISNLRLSGYGRKRQLDEVRLHWSSGSVVNWNDCAWLPDSAPSVYTLHYHGDGQPGDSGAPLFYRMKNQAMLLGVYIGGGPVVSAPVLASHPDYPQYAEPVAEYLELITAQTKNNSPEVIHGWTPVSCTTEANAE